MSALKIFQSQKPCKINSYECTGLSKRFSNNLQVLYEKREFFDLLLIGSDAIQIRAHQIIVSALSEYFLEKFRSMPKPPKPLVIEVKEYNSTILESVLQFMYTSSIDLCIETIKDVLKAADHFKMKSLIDICWDFMKQELSSANCLSIALFASENGLSELSGDFFSFAYTKFEQVCSGNDFLELEYEMLYAILSRDDLGVSSEDKIVKALLMWLEHDRQSRQKNWLNLLSNVRYQFLTHKFLMENTSAIGINTECHELIRSWIQWHLLPGKRSNSKDRARPRKGYQAAKLVGLMGWCTNALYIHTYYPEFNIWTNEKLSNSSYEAQYFSSIIVDNEVVIIAGGAGRDDIRTNQVQFFHIKTQHQSLWTPMRLARSSPGISLLKGHLYIVGGIGVEQNECRNLRCVERFNTSSRRWQDVGSLLLAIPNVKTAVLNGLLYAIGSNIMQCYNPTDNRWTLRASKTEKSDCFGLVAVGGHLFTVGGRLSNGMKSATVERYTPLSDSWQVISSLKSPREQPKCLAFNNSFVVIGGFYRWEWLNTVEEYNIESNEWKTLAPMLNTTITVYSAN